MPPTTLSALRALLQPALDAEAAFLSPVEAPLPPVPLSPDDAYKAGVEDGRVRGRAEIARTVAGLLGLATGEDPAPPSTPPAPAYQPNPDLYARLSQPRPPSQARSAVRAFDEAVQRARVEHGIAELLLICGVVSAEGPTGASTLVAASSYGAASMLPELVRAAKLQGKTMRREERKALRARLQAEVDADPRLTSDAIDGDPKRAYDDGQKRGRSDLARMLMAILPGEGGE